MNPTQEQRDAAATIREYLAAKVQKLMMAGDMDQARRQFGMPIIEILSEIENDPS